MPRIRFTDHALVLRLVEAAITSGKPLMLAHDHGVYLCTDAIRDSGGRCLCAFAVGCDPGLDEDAFETARALVGGDDFGISMPLGRHEALLADLRRGDRLLIGFGMRSVSICTRPQPTTPHQPTLTARGRGAESHPTARTPERTKDMTTTTMKKATKKTDAKSNERLKKAAIKEIGERIASMEGAAAPEGKASAESATVSAGTAPAATTATKGKKGAKAKAEKPVKAAKAPKVAKLKRLSALDAAAIVLKSAKEPMNSDALIVEMANRKLWVSPNGQTPSQTLYAALGREINSKGKQSRFTKVERGLFAFNGKAS